MILGSFAFFTTYSLIHKRMGTGWFLRSFLSLKFYYFMILSLWTEKKIKSSQSKWDENDFNHCVLNWWEERERDQWQYTMGDLNRTWIRDLAIKMKKKRPILSLLLKKKCGRIWWLIQHGVWIEKEATTTVGSVPWGARTWGFFPQWQQIWVGPDAFSGKMILFSQWIA